VSYNKPYLFKYNSRPRKIRISYEGEIAKTIELLDTPNFQEILTLWPYPQYESSYPDKNLWEKDLWIEIIDVYPGTRYNDTCINFLVWFYIQ
jgi:hypothetical protein